MEPMDDEQKCKVAELRSKIVGLLREANIAPDVTTGSVLLWLASDCLDGPPYSLEQIQWFIGLAANLMTDGKAKTVMMKVPKPQAPEN